MSGMWSFRRAADVPGRDGAPPQDAESRLGALMPTIRLPVDYDYAYDDAAASSPAPAPPVVIRPLSSPDLRSNAPAAFDQVPSLVSSSSVAAAGQSSSSPDFLRGHQHGQSSASPTHGPSSQPVPHDDRSVSFRTPSSSAVRDREASSVRSVAVTSPAKMNLDGDGAPTASTTPAMEDRWEALMTETLDPDVADVLAAFRAKHSMLEDSPVQGGPEEAGPAPAAAASPSQPDVAYVDRLAEVAHATAEEAKAAAHARSVAARYGGFDSNLESAASLPSTARRQAEAAASSPAAHESPTTGDDSYASTLASARRAPSAFRSPRAPTTSDKGRATGGAGRTLPAASAIPRYAQPTATRRAAADTQAAIRTRNVDLVDSKVRRAEAALAPPAATATTLSASRAPLRSMRAGSADARRVPPQPHSSDVSKDARCVTRHEAAEKAKRAVNVPTMAQAVALVKRHADPMMAHQPPPSMLRRSASASVSRAAGGSTTSPRAAAPTMMTARSAAATATATTETQRRAAVPRPLSVERFAATRSKRLAQQRDAIASGQVRLVFDPRRLVDLNRVACRERAAARAALHAGAHADLATALTTFRAAQLLRYYGLQPWRQYVARRRAVAEAHRDAKAKRAHFAAWRAECRRQQHLRRERAVERTCSLARTLNGLLLRGFVWRWRLHLQRQQEEMLVATHHRMRAVLRRFRARAAELVVVEQHGRDTKAALIRDRVLCRRSIRAWKRVSEAKQDEVARLAIRQRFLGAIGRA